MKRILITGANRGLGLGLTQAYLKRGERVFATCRTPDQAEDLAALKAAYPQMLGVLPLDISEAESIQQCAARVAEQVSGVDLLINNAAINPGDEGLLEVQSHTLLETLQVNAVGSLLAAQQFLPLLRKGKK